VFHFSMSTTLRLVFDETFFDRERNLLKRMTQIDVKTTIRVMTTRKQMKNRNDSNIRTFQQSIEKEEIHHLLSRLFSTTRTTIIICNLQYYSLNLNHLLIRRLVSFHTIRIRREKTIILKHLRLRFLIAVCS
jgi:homospermidine synthase